MKSVLHFRLDAPGIYSSDGIMKAFMLSGYDYYSLDWQQERFSNGVENLRKRMIVLAHGLSILHGPLTIFLHIQNSEILDVATVIELSKYGFVVNFTFDVRDKEGTEWMYELAPYCGYTFFAAFKDVSECAARGIDNTGVVHSSCDYDLYKPNNLNKTRDIVFIGNRTDITNLNFPQSRKRVEMVEKLSQEFGSSFSVFGLGWDYSKIVSPSEEISIYNSAKIAICHNHFSEPMYCSDRQWRAMGCGTMTLMQYYLGIEKDFPDNCWGDSPVNLISWLTIDDIIRLCHHWLHFEKMREYVSFLGREIVLKNHAWVNRIEYMIKHSTCKKKDGNQ